MNTGFMLAPADAQHLGPQAAPSIDGRGEMAQQEDLAGERYVHWPNDSTFSKLHILEKLVCIQRARD